LNWDGDVYLFYQIFTWHGATIELDGFSEAEYTADEVTSYLLISGLELLPLQLWLSKEMTNEYGTGYFSGQKEVSCMYFSGNSSYYDL
jgi:hypothetical protein